MPLCQLGVLSRADLVAGLAPCRVMVTGVSMRQLGLPTASRPWTWMPAVCSEMPISLASECGEMPISLASDGGPMMSSLPAGIVIKPSVPRTDCESKTLLPSGSVTSSPG